jgi:hypothetical protein
MPCERKCNHKVIKGFGFVAIGLAAVNTIVSQISHHPYNPGVSLSNEAMALLGVITVLIAKCLHNIEKTIDAPTN